MISACLWALVCSAQQDAEKSIGPPVSVLEEMQAKTVNSDYPNIVLIYADDLGYGDLSCYGAAKIKTPNIDRLANEGRLFTDAHSTSAVCTPSRYALLTGEYPLRINNYSPVFCQSQLIIDAKKSTLASMLKRKGYATATDTVEKNCMGCHQGKAMLDLDVTRDSRFRKAKQGRGKSIDPGRALNLSRPESSLFLLAPLAKSAGGFQLCNGGKKDGSPILHDKGPEYQTILDYIRVLHEAQNTNKRFNMPGFRPPPHYVRQMKRYGVIPADYNRSQPLDVYAADRQYWESFWYRPASEPGDR